MNISVYIFKKRGSESGGKVVSFPTALDKGTQKVVGDIKIEGEGNADLVIWRKDGLVYYIYALNVEGDIFGFIFILNNVYLAEVEPLCCFCSDIIGTISAKHLLLKWSQTGELRFTDARFMNCKQEAHEVMERLDEIRNVSVFDKAIELPPLDYSSENKPTFIYCRDAEDVKPVPKKACRVNFVEILLPKFEFPVGGVIHSVYDTALSWKKHYDDLTQKYARLNNQKKRMKWVVILCLCIVAGGFVLLAVNRNLKLTQSNLSEAHTAIDSLSVEKAVLISDVDSLYKIAEIYNHDIGSLKSSYNSATQKISYYESKIPIEITSMDLKYKEKEDGYYSIGIPDKNKARKIFFDVKYKVNRYQTAATSIYPSVELYWPQWYTILKRANLIENEATIENEAKAEDEQTSSRPTKLNLELRCYYKRSNKSDYILKYTETFEKSPATSVDSSSFATPSFSMGFNVLPEGVYRIELWNGRRCLYYTTFTIS